MEKRLLLAFILSFLVLSLWSAITPKPSFQQNNAPIPVASDSVVVKSQNSVHFSKEKPNLTQKISENIKEKTETLESDKLLAWFSNKGGSLKKIEIKEFGTSLPITNINNILGYEDYIFSLEAKTDQTIIYSYEDETYKISKVYELTMDDYIVQSEIKIYNKSDKTRLDNINIESFTIDSSRMDKNKKNFIQERSLYEYVIYLSKGFQRKNKAFKFSQKERKEGEGEIQWVGFRDRYFCALIKPRFDVSRYFINPMNNKKLAISLTTQDIKMTPKGSVSLSSTIYYGPEKTQLLKKYDLDFEKIKRYYKLGLFDAIAKFISHIMHLLYKLIPNWGVCIILISTLIYFSMYPMTIRSMQSMKKMQALQPHLVKLREKHKNNPQKLNKEMMELYKKHGANPIGGCLPMFLQIPIFIGLYQVLWRSVSFKGASFLWIKDLSEPDRFFILPVKLPFIGNELNILPILMVVIMAFQQKLSAKNMVATTPEQKAQQKMIATIMPLFMVVLFYKFASGLTLYFTMFYLFSTFTQWKMLKVNVLKVD